MGALLQGLRWPRSAGGTGRGFGHCRLHPNWAEGPVFTASGKGTGDEAPGFLLSGGDVREVIEVFPGVPGSRERSGGLLVCRWFVLCTRGLSAAPALSCSTPGTAGTAWPPHRDSRTTPITRGFAAKASAGPRNALCSHCFSLCFSWVHWRKSLVLKSQRCVWRTGWVCPRMKQSGGITWMIITWHGYIGKALGGRWVLDSVPAKTSPLDFHGADDPQRKVTTCWKQ